MHAILPVNAVDTDRILSTRPETIRPLTSPYPVGQGEFREVNQNAGRPAERRESNYVSASNRSRGRNARQQGRATFRLDTDARKLQQALREGQCKNNPIWAGAFNARRRNAEVAQDQGRIGAGSANGGKFSDQGRAGLARGAWPCVDRGASEEEFLPGLPGGGKVPIRGPRARR